MSKSTATRARPISPHLQIYRPIPTMVMSIVHRITGGALYFGTLLVAVWLIAAATSREAFDTVQTIYGSWPGLLVLAGYSWALIHHMIGGIRHLVWDTGIGLGKEQSTRIAIIMPFVSVGLTLLVWVAGIMARGG
jgi:succinate dehydrogenase / fumarate reductase cytochrome b subunit